MLPLPASSCESTQLLWPCSMWIPHLSPRCRIFASGDWDRQSESGHRRRGGKRGTPLAAITRLCWSHVGSIINLSHYHGRQVRSDAYYRYCNMLSSLAEQTLATGNAGCFLRSRNVSRLSPSLIGRVPTRKFSISRGLLRGKMPLIFFHPGPVGAPPREALWVRPSFLSLPLRWI